MDSVDVDVGSSEISDVVDIAAIQHSVEESHGKYIVNAV